MKVFMFTLGIATIPVLAIGGVAMGLAYHRAFQRLGREAARLAAWRAALGVTAATLLVWTLALSNPDAGRSANLVPFREIARSLRSLESAHTGYGMINFWGNVVVFVPLGALLVLALPRDRGSAWAVAIGLGVAFSACIEVAQYVIGRAADVDDVILNGLGVMVGATLALPFYRTSRNRSGATLSRTV